MTSKGAPGGVFYIAIYNNLPCALWSWRRQGADAAKEAPTRQGCADGTALIMSPRCGHLRVAPLLCGARTDKAPEMTQLLCGAGADKASSQTS